MYVNTSITYYSNQRKERKKKQEKTTVPFKVQFTEQSAYLFYLIY